MKIAMRCSIMIAVVLLLPFPARPLAAPRADPPRPDPRRVSALPSHLERVASSIVGIHVEVPPDRPSVATLGAALVDVAGAVVGITSLRLGEAPFVNLAIPIEQFLGGKQELVAKGRVESRRARPWIGLYTRELAGWGVMVAGVSPIGPARAAGFRPGDLIVRVNGSEVSGQAEFYRRLWLGVVGQDVQLVVLRDARLEAITVRPVDRYHLLKTSDR